MCLLHSGISGMMPLIDSVAGCRGIRVEEFIAHENIRRFKAQLHSATDKEQRAVIQSLLRAEEQRLAAILAAKEKV